jgi:hypothetical protein
LTIPDAWIEVSGSTPIRKKIAAPEICRGTCPSSGVNPSFADELGFNPTTSRSHFLPAAFLMPLGATLDSQALCYDCARSVLKRNIFRRAAYIMVGDWAAEIVAGECVAGAWAETFRGTSRSLAAGKKRCEWERARLKMCLARLKTCLTRLKTCLTTPKPAGL